MNTPDDKTHVSDSPEKSNHLALWAGVTTLLTNLAAINVVVWLGDESDPRVSSLAALITSFAVAGSVYARQKYADAKATRQQQSGEQ